MSASSGSYGSRENHVWSPLLAVLTCIYTILFGLVFRHSAYGEPGGFPVFYTAGRLARFDLRGLYNQHMQDVFHQANDGVGYFFHLPYETILLVPLSYLPQTFAFALWSLLNLELWFRTFIDKQGVQTLAPPQAVHTDAYSVA